jgi:hypothetical protein
MSVTGWEQQAAAAAAVSKLSLIITTIIATSSIYNLVVVHGCTRRSMGACPAAACC